MRRLTLPLWFVFAGCDKPVTPSQDGRDVAAVAVSPRSARLLPGDSVRFEAEALDANGEALANVTVSWATRNPGLATVQDGRVRAGALPDGLAADTTWVIVSAGARTDSARVVVANAVTPAAAARLGMNLAMVNDWSTEWPFNDVFRSSRYWIPQREGAAWGQGGSLALTAGNDIASLEPGQYATTIVLNDASGHQPGGDYVLLYEGEGEITFDHNPNVSVLSQSPGRMVVRVLPSTTGVFMNVRRTNPANPLRRFRFLRPGTEASYAAQPFGDDFLRVIRPFGVLRFMQWQWTNDNPVSEWPRRSTPGFASYAGPWGVSVETMVALANATGADPWFCMPHNATDDYVRQFALLIRALLAPGQRVYVEYSNEVWNSIFPQATYVRQNGTALGLSPDPFQASLRFYSQRAVEMFAIWRSAFGADSNRVVRVLASQASNAWTAEQVLAWRDAHDHADAIAVAPYFGGYLGGGDGAQQSGMTETQVLDALAADIEGPVRAWIEANATIARRYGVRFVAYEGGQHLESSGMSAAHEPAVTQLFHAANRHSRMGELYRRYFELWFMLGGDLFLAYEDAGVWSRYGSWGALEYIQQDPATSPKYQAILDAAARFGSP